MILSRLLGELRSLIGSPTQQVCADRDLMSFLVPSIQWLAGHLKFSIKTDDNIGLVAEGRTIPLPPDFLYSVWVSIAGNLLEPSTVWVLNSGVTTNTGVGISGQTWMTVASGTPRLYAIQGRELILYPPPSAAFVAATPVLSWRYISSGAHFTQQGTVGITAQGIPALSDLDESVVMYDAAIGWLSAHPSDENAARIAAYQSQVSRLLPECKRRMMDAIEPSTKTLRPYIDRQGAAR